MFYSFFFAIIATICSVQAKGRDRSSLPAREGSVRSLDMTSSLSTLWATLNWSFDTNSYTIKDLNDTLKYKIDQHFFSWGHDFDINDANDKMITECDQHNSFNPMSWIKRKYNMIYEHEDGTKRKGTIERDWSFGFGTKWQSFNIVLEDGRKYRTHGDYFQWKFQISQLEVIDGKEVEKEVSKVQIEGQDFVRKRFPGLQAYRIETDTTRIPITIPLAIVNIVEQFSKQKDGYRRSGTRLPLVVPFPVRTGGGTNNGRLNKPTNSGGKPTVTGWGVNGKPSDTTKPPKTSWWDSPNITKSYRKRSGKRGRKRGRR
jgi:uncharacterized protein YxjI